MRRSLPGCWSQGDTEEDALANIAVAIREYLEADDIDMDENAEMRGDARGRGGHRAMPGLPGVNHLEAVRALQKVGFRVIRQGKHIIMSNGERQVGDPPAQPGQRDHNGRDRPGRGPTVEEFRSLL